MTGLKAKTPWGRALEKFRLDLGLGLGDAARVCGCARGTYTVKEREGSPARVSEAFKALSTWSRRQHEIMARAKCSGAPPPVQAEIEDPPVPNDLSTIKARLWQELDPLASRHPYNSSQASRVAECLSEVIEYLEGAE